MPVGRRQVEHGDPLLFDPVGEATGIEHVVTLAKHQGCPGDPGRENLLDGKIEMKRRELENAIVGPQAKKAAGRQVVVDDRAVRDGHSARRSGRARREDHISGALWSGSRLRA